jgi:hypothetical protein
MKLSFPVFSRYFVGVLALVVAIAASARTGIAQAQAPAGAAGQPAGRGAPRPPQNLQILPKDIPGQELVATMRGFTQALGVQCGYCHVEEPARDFASDAKQTKKTARVMMQMVTHVNEMLATGVGKPAADVTKVQCMTCHRGEAIPKTPAPAQPAAAPR